MARTGSGSTLELASTVEIFWTDGIGHHRAWNIVEAVTYVNVPPVASHRLNHIVMKEYQGNCHCGAISFSFEHEKIDTGLRCNCSICKRKGAVMSVFTLAPNEIRIEERDGALRSYQFDTKVAKHHFCGICGIYPFHQTLRKPGHYRVNLGCIDDIDTEELSVELFDGKRL